MNLINCPSTLAGVDIYINNSDLTRSQKLKMMSCGCSDEALRSMNNFLAKMFGYTYHCYAFGSKVHMHGDLYDNLRGLTK